jgi:predicted DNA-binding mobile mystery protein A
MVYRIDSVAFARKDLDNRLAPFRKSNEGARPPRGWIGAIVQALGMAKAPLARRERPPQPVFTEFEKAQIEGSVTLKTLRQVAESTNCTLVYALVPNTLLED